MTRPHALRAGVSYWTQCPFEAASHASLRGLTVARYPSGQHLPGMVASGLSGAAKNNWFGYGVADPDGGFLLIDWQAGRRAANLPEPPYQPRGTDQ